MPKTGAAITTGTTFLPCFLFVFLGAPYIENPGEQTLTSAAPPRHHHATTTAVAGVILNLGVNFTTHAMWPDHGSVFDSGITVITVIPRPRFKVGLMPVIGVCALPGWPWEMLFVE